MNGFSRTRASATLVSALSLVIAACVVQRTLPESAAPPLLGSWRLVEFRSSDDATGTIRPEDPARFTLTLEPDGRASMRLDCNRGSGSWTSSAGGDTGSFTFGPVAMTRAYCGPTSLDVRIARDAEHVRSYVLADGRLHLNLMADAGSYVWERASDGR
jgi:heat shock protein HslJ